MLLGYARISKGNGSQVLDLQLDALRAAGVPAKRIYTDELSGTLDDRPGLDACLKALRASDTLVIWKLDRLGRNMRHLVNTVYDLMQHEINLVVTTMGVDTRTPVGKMVFGIFAAFAEFERELIVERTKAGLLAARARGRVGGRKSALSKHQVGYLLTCMKDRTASVSELAAELKISPATLYRYVSPTGEARDAATKVIGKPKAKLKRVVIPTAEKTGK